MAEHDQSSARQRAAHVQKPALRPARLMWLAFIGLVAAGFAVVAPKLPEGNRAAAQDNNSWTMPWDRPRASRRRRREPPAPAGPGYQGNFERRAGICLRLEQRLVQDANKGLQSRELLPKLDEDIRRFRKLHRSARRQLKRKNCYDVFLFIKTLKQSRKCQRMAREADDAKTQIRDLKSQRQQILGGSRGNSYQDEIVAALARNNCGANYKREARRRSRSNNPFSSSFWQDNDSFEPAPRRRYGALPFATYRTLCVRLCDGYYFPVSFSTLPNHFQRDASRCQSKCAAPAELYYHQNPGGSVEQMVSVGSQTPYTDLGAAWRYRKEYVQGCSCKQADYVPGGEVREKKADASGAPGGQSDIGRSLLRR